MSETNLWSQINEGIGLGSQMAHCARVESDMLKGVHRMSLATHQYEAIEAAFDSIEDAFGWQIPARSFWIVGLTPFVLGITAAKTSTERLPYVKKVVVLLQSQIGTVCQVAMLVSATVNIMNGKVISGALTISCLALGVFSRFEFMSQDVADKFDYAFSVIGWVNGIFTGSWVTSVISAFGLTDMLLEIAVRLKETKAPEIPIVNITLAEFEQKTIDAFEINPIHLSIPLSPLPELPKGVNIEILKTWFSEIDLQSVLWREEGQTETKDITAEARLYTLVTNDVQWKEDPLRKTTITDLKDYVEDGLNKFIRQLSRRKDNDSAKTKAALCVQKMQSMTPEERFEYVISFGLTGHYCPRGFGNETGLVHAALFGDLTNNNFIPQRIYQALHSEREYEFKSFINRAYNWDVGGWKIANLLLQLFIGDQIDPHSDDVFQATFGHEYNLLTVDEAELNLPVEHRSGPLSNMTLDLPWRLLARNDFKNRYTTQEVARIVNNTLFAFKDEERVQLIQWFEENFPSEWASIQESFSVESPGSSFYQMIFSEDKDGNYTIKKEWLLPMLVKMNVLRAKDGA